MTVPVYVAAITSGTVENAAEIADGIMPIFWSPERVRRSTHGRSNTAPAARATHACPKWVRATGPMSDPSKIAA